MMPPPPPPLPYVCLEWDFTPSNLFEGEVTGQGSGYAVCADAGKAVAYLMSESLPDYSAHQAAAEEHIGNLIRGAQVVAHEACTLAGPRVTVFRTDGSRGIVLQVQPGVIRIRGYAVDLSYTRADGTVVDTRKERVDRKRALAEGFATFRGRDPVLDRMARSYRAAIETPTDELLHLYEIRDAAQTRFHGKERAMSALSIDPAEWSWFGMFCNVHPIRQGRHRGKFVEAELRDATDAELSRARQFAVLLISNYLATLAREAPQVDAGHTGTEPRVGP